MSALQISLIVFGCTCLSALAGMAIRRGLPAHHLDGESRDVMKLVMGLIATIAALVLGLLIASSKASFDQQREELQEIAASIVDLDRLLAHYGPETKPAREMVYAGVLNVANQLRAGQSNEALREAVQGQSGVTEGAFDHVVELKPTSDGQQFLKQKALEAATAIRHLRLLMVEQVRGGLPWPFVVVLVFWICLLFLGFGLFTRPHATVIVGLAVGALSVASALFLILELRMPYQGLMRVSGGTFESVLAQINH